MIPQGTPKAKVQKAIACPLLGLATTGPGLGPVPSVVVVPWVGPLPVPDPVPVAALFVSRINTPSATHERCQGPKSSTAATREGTTHRGGCLPDC
eukprot:COSAG02_NODE_4385_length_5421_cov_4.928035_6_plen_95_part_00